LSGPCSPSDAQDILELAEAFIAASRSRYGVAVKRLNRQAAARLLVARDWPENVRELEMTIARTGTVGRKLPGLREAIAALAPLPGLVGSIL
jgi:DNA-binding NtrC family response regulator